MTIKVTIKHDQPGYPQDIIVRTYRTEGGATEWAGVEQRLKHGESASLYVYKGQGIAINEADAE
jgi:hypothetical protein